MPRPLTAALLAACLALPAVGPAGLAAPAAAQTSTATADTEVETTPQQKLMARRAAELDAYRLLAERILGFEIAADTTVRDFVGESDVIAAELDTFIKSVEITNVRHYSDLSCEVDAQVTLQQVITTLKAVSEKHDNGDDTLTEEDFARMTADAVEKVISVTGSGAAYAESDIPDPADAAITGPLLGTTEIIRLNLPPIFKKYPPAERLKAKRAAELDAYRKLLERVYGLEIDADTTVRDFITTNDRIRTTAEGVLKGVRFDNVRYAPDGVVEVGATLTLQQVISTIQKIYEKEYDGDNWTKTDFEKIREESVTKKLTVVGTGALDVEGTSRGPKVRRILSGSYHKVRVID